MVDFPNFPIDGQLHSEEGKTWSFRAMINAWVVAADGGQILPYFEEFHDEVERTGYRIHGKTLEIWGREGGGTTDARTVTFAKRFKKPPIVNATVERSANDRWCQVQGVTTSKADVRAFDAAGAAADEPILWYAIGEWTEASSDFDALWTIGIKDISGGAQRVGFEEGAGYGALDPQDVGTDLNCTFLQVRSDFPTIMVFTFAGSPQNNGSQITIDGTVVDTMVVTINDVDYNFAWNSGNGRYQSTDIDFFDLFSAQVGSDLPVVIKSFTGSEPPSTPADTVLTGDYGKTQTDLDPPAGNGVIDARTASWTVEIGANLNQYPVRVRNYSGTSWIYGGTINSDISQTEPWSDLYKGSGVNSAALFMQNNGLSKASGWDFDGAWDAMRFTGSYSVENMYVKRGRDDAVEADKQQGTDGRIRNCFFESMVGVSFTETSTDRVIDIADTLIYGKMYPYNDPTDFRSFGPLKCDGTAGSRWKAHNVVLAVEDLNNNNNQARAWQVLLETTGDCRFLNLTDNPIGNYPAPPGGWGAGSGWTLVQGQAARDELAAWEAAWLAANRPFTTPVEPADP